MGDIPQGVGTLPEIACYNSKGDRRVVEVFDSYEEARERAPVIEEEFRSMGTPEWCERYGIPLAFVSGMKVEVEPFRSVIWRVRPPQAPTRTGKTDHLGVPDRRVGDLPIG